MPPSVFTVLGDPAASIGHPGWIDVLPPTMRPLTIRWSGSVQPSERSVRLCGTGMPRPAPLFASVLTT